VLDLKVSWVMRDLVKDWIQLFWKKTKDKTSETCLCLHSEHESMEFLILIAFFSIKYCNIHTHKHIQYMYSDSPIKHEFDLFTCRQCIFSSVNLNPSHSNTIQRFVTLHAVDKLFIRASCDNRPEISAKHTSLLLLVTHSTN